ncbi:hypothetical protein PR048_030278 [Dryococelus australis]|uniref:DNA mismatch repair protein MutS-like N-terminal domain-containing protein n=1 Tax=Dryococelus australis TaxID=614101 RepID=A0ABQ9GBF0_9NEOP|nr:hypothetical protein PR048_030278 [Dryococelus australis]
MILNMAEEESVAKKSKLARYASSRARRPKVSPSAAKSKSFIKNRKETEGLSRSSPANLFDESESCVQDPGCDGTLPTSSTKGQFTPLEEQMLQLKQQHPGLVLMIQNAYMYTFFGEDAEIAANVLKVSSYWSQNFLVAVVPITRLSVHIHRLVQAATGETVCDEFSDGPDRSELDKRLEHLQPVEVLVSEDVSENTERLLNHRHVLLDKLPSAMFSSENSFSELVTSSSGGVDDSAAFQTWKNLFPVTLSCVAVLLQHLKKFGLQAALRLSSGGIVVRLLTFHLEEPGSIAGGGHPWDFTHENCAG